MIRNATMEKYVHMKTLHSLLVKQVLVPQGTHRYAHPKATHDVLMTAILAHAVVDAPHT